ncbi:MAG: protein translocase subunit SecDF [Bacteroidetes bacterium]|nr:protein translocase subunit SecDF [Bacteroidota bacterium]MDA1336669.1 protein translocase subunit SecDF [Bacteroidota bacterium]
MQNKNAILLFTILLALATVYTLSLSVVSSNLEEAADKYGVYVADSLLTKGEITNEDSAATQNAAAREYLRDTANVWSLPLIPSLYSISYEEASKRELNLGLDLQGGMSVTLEVSIPDLIIALSDYSNDETFLQAISDAKAAQSETQGMTYVDLFEVSWKELNAANEKPVELWQIFSHEETKDLFSLKSTDDEIFAILRSEAQTAINNTESIIRKRIDQLGVAQPNVQKVSGGRILVELPGIDDRERARKQLKSTANLEFWETYFNQEVIQRLDAANTAISQALYPDLASVPDSAITEEQRLQKIPLFQYFKGIENRPSAVIGYVSVADTGRFNSLLKRPEARLALRNDLMLLWDAKPRGNLVALYGVKDESRKGKAVLSGKSIVNARRDFDEIGDVVVSMTMDSEGAEIWGQMTTRCAADNQRAVAIVLDGLVFSAPSVQSAITSGRSQISFGSDQSINEKITEADDLASLLKAGSLPAPARIVDEVSVGPQLGEENIQAGLSSFFIALMVILVYMIFYYKGAGLVSNLALIANLVFLIGALASLGAALTLPGIAGIVLTIGMAVDANVLIYERIREEMRSGKGLMVALKDGYSKAYSAIIDANLTTLLTAFVLYSFGSGAIRGFATTLIIGIFTSLFTAIVLTRLVFFSRLENQRGISFYTNMTKNWFTSINVNFVGNRFKFYVLSGLLVVGGLASLMTKGLQYGVEFSGGTTYDITFESAVDVQQLRESLSEAFTEDGKKGNPIVQTKGSDSKVRVMTNYMIDDRENEQQDEMILAALESGLSQSGTNYTIDEYNKVDSTISDDFRSGAQNATIFSLLIIFLYIFFRFRKWQYGLGALIAMVHDVVIVLSCFSIFAGILPFTMEIDQAFIAAILTVIGYSINDTVVVFDRIREYVGLYGSKRDDQTVMNDALNSTLSRTINTSLSTFVVLLTIFLLGGDNIKGFVFALMVGVVVGTYSSIFIATPSVLDLSKKLKA